MKRRLEYTKLILWIFATVFSSEMLYAQQAKNVLIIYSDDQSYNTIQAWGNHEIKTPNLDRLVKQGLSFRQAHVMGGHQGAV